MKRGFELLETRKLDDQFDIEAIEDKYNIKLPPLYKLFVQLFIIGEDKIKYDKACISDSSFHYISYFDYYPNNDTSFAGFNDVNKAIELREELEEWVENSYLPIGYCGFNGGILLGTRGDEVDKIILHDFEREPYFKVLADNIFEFVKGLVLKPNTYSKIDTGNLYKNWGEDFWRIREDKSE